MMLHTMFRRAATCPLARRLALAAQPSRISGLPQLQQFATSSGRGGRGGGFAQRKGNTRPRLSHNIMSPDEILASVVDGTSVSPPALAASLSHFVKKRGNTSDPRLDLLVKKLTAAAPRMYPQHISAVFVACTRMANQGQFADSGSISSLHQALCNAGVKKVSVFEAQAIANTLNSLAHLHVARMATEHSDVFARLLLDVVPNEVGSFNAQGIANTVWAMATLGHSDTRALGALLGAAEQKADSFKAQEIANTVWAMATLGHSDTRALGVLLGAAEQKADSFNAQGIANTVWAMACLNVDHQPTVQSLWTRVSNTEVSDWSDSELTQLFSVLNWFKLEKSEWGMLVSPTLEGAASAATLRSHNLAKSSQFHKQVSTILNQMGVPHDNERDIGGQLVDIAIEQDNVVLEVDEPHHYCQSDRLIMLGNYRLKQRLLEAQGWRVVHIPFYEWQHPDMKEEKRVVYLKDKLKSL